jgi:hypothetical protein
MKRKPRPQRIQLLRKKGFRLQEVSLALNGLPAVKVDRTTKWGNPYRVGMYKNFDAAQAIAAFEHRLEHEDCVWHLARDARKELRGKNLACWCKPGAPCHADVLLKYANKR